MTTSCFYRNRYIELLFILNKKKDSHELAHFPARLHSVNAKSRGGKGRDLQGSEQSSGTRFCGAVRGPCGARSPSGATPGRLGLLPFPRGCQLTPPKALIAFFMGQLHPKVLVHQLRKCLPKKKKKSSVLTKKKTRGRHAECTRESIALQITKKMRAQASVAREPRNASGSAAGRPRGRALAPCRRQALRASGRGRGWPGRRARAVRAPRGARAERSRAPAARGCCRP